MPYLRRLPSGKWQATVYLPNGRRRTYSAPLKGEAREWGAAQEARIRRGDWTDPKVGRVLYDDWRTRWWDARVVESETARSDTGTLGKWVDPAWSGQPLAAITRMDVQTWVRSMQRDGAGPHAIRRAYNLFTSMLGAAVLEGILAQTPCRKITLPATPPKSPAWFTPEQAQAIVDQLVKSGYPRHAAGVALMCWSGLRWGEMAGLRIKDIDFDRRRVLVVGSRTQLGAWKEYPKSAMSRREVPIEPRVLPLLAAEVRGRGPDETLFVTPRQSRPMSAANWRRVWDEAVRAAGVPAHPPHTCRHTAASWLVQDGIDLYRVQALLGHESYATTAKYAHLRPDHHGAVEDAWRRIAPPALEAVSTS